MHLGPQGEFGERARRCAQLLRGQEGDIAREWMEASRARTAAGRLPEESLEDHMSPLVSRLIDTLEEAGAAEAELRVGDVAREFAIARLSSSLGSKTFPYQSALSARIRPPFRTIRIDSS